MNISLTEYPRVGTTYAETTNVFTFSLNPFKVQKKTETEWRVGKGTRNNPEQRARYRGPLKETWAITGWLKQRDIETLEDLGRRNSKYRFENLLVSPTKDGIDTTLNSGVSSGSSVLPVTSTAGFTVDDYIRLDLGNSNNQEIFKIGAIGGGNLTCYTACSSNHSSGASVLEIDKVMVVINNITYNQQKVKIGGENPGEEEELIPYTLNLTRSRINDTQDIYEA